MKLLKGIGKLTYRVFHPVRTFVTSKAGSFLANIKERINKHKEEKGKLFTDEQFNAILLEQRNKEQEFEDEIYADENIISFDEIREEKEVKREKININELVHEYLKNSRIDAFGAEKIFEGIDKIEELGKTDELVNYINESNDIIPDKRYQKLLDKMYDIVNNVKKDENIDIFDYLSVYLPDDLSDEQRLNVYQAATKAIEDNKYNEDKIREYLDSKKYYMPALSIDKYNELMSMLKSLTNIDELDSDDRVEVIEELAEINDFDATKRDDSKKINEKNINNVDEAFALYRNGEISKEEFKEVMVIAKKDDEIIRKSIMKEQEVPEVIETKAIEENIGKVEIPTIVSPVETEKTTKVEEVKEKTLEEKINDLKIEREKILELKQKMYMYSLYHKQNKDDKYRYREEIFELNDLISSKEKAYNDSYDKLIEEKNEIIRKANEELEMIQSNELIKKLV